MNYSYMRSDIPRSNAPAEIDQALQFTPRSTLSLWATADVWHGLKVGGGAQYMDSVFRNATNTTSVPSYWLINGLASYDISDHFTLRLNANNIGNAKYVDRASGGHYIPGAGRSVALSAGLGF
jgi:catecholate siderophore receptor